jgi:hypothetical protein
MSNLSAARSFEPGQNIITLNGRYRVTGKVASATGERYRLTDSAGVTQVLTAAQIEEKVVLSRRMARIAACFKTILAYNRNFDAMVKDSIYKAGLPVDESIDWSKWFDQKFAKRMHGTIKLWDEDLADEAIDHVITQELVFPKKDPKTGQMRTWNQKMDLSKAPKDVKERPEAEQITWYLQWIFSNRYDDAVQFTNKQYGWKGRDVDQLDTTDSTTFDADGNPVDYSSSQLFQEDENGNERNILDTEEHATSQSTHPEDADILSIRDEFAAYLEEEYKAPIPERVIKLFDLIIDSDTGKRAEYLKKFQQETGLSEASFKILMTQFKKALVGFEETHGEAFSQNELMKLLRGIKPPAAKPAPAMASGSRLASFFEVATEEDAEEKTAADRLPPPPPAPPPPPTTTAQPVAPSAPGQVPQAAPVQNPSGSGTAPVPQNSNQPLQPQQPNVQRGTIAPEIPGENHVMASTKKELLKKIEARKAARQKAAGTKFAKLRRLATEEPAEVESALGELAEALGGMSEALTNLKDNLDLGGTDSVDIEVAKAAKNKYAKNFRRLVAEAPEELANAVNELWHSLDAIAVGTEALADNLGIELSEEPELTEEEDTEHAFGENPHTEDEAAPEESDEPEDDVEEEELVEDEVKEASGSDGWFIQDKDKKKASAVNKILASLKNMSSSELEALL